MSEKVAVAVDGGPASRAALAWVVDRAVRGEMEVEITTVAGLEAELPGGAEVDFRTPPEQTLKEAVDLVHSMRPDLAVTTRIRFGLAANALVRASHGRDVLVLGTNKTFPIAGILHGTLALKVAGRAACATVVVPASWAPAAGSVVVGWRDDETAASALDAAALEAERTRSELVIVHSWSPPQLGLMDGGAEQSVIDRLIAAARRDLAEAADRIRRDHPSLVVRQEMHTGSAVVALVRAATGASLVVVGSRGRGAVAGFFLGSVSHDVLLNMPAPVMVIPGHPAPVDDDADDENL